MIDYNVEDNTGTVLKTAGIIIAVNFILAVTAIINFFASAGLYVYECFAKTVKLHKNTNFKDSVCLSIKKCSKYKDIFVAAVISSN